MYIFANIPGKHPQQHRQSRLRTCTSKGTCTLASRQATRPHHGTCSSETTRSARILLLLCLHFYAHTTQQAVGYCVSACRRLYYLMLFTTSRSARDLINPVTALPSGEELAPPSLLRAPQNILDLTSVASPSFHPNFQIADGVRSCLKYETEHLRRNFRLYFIARCSNWANKLELGF